MTAIRLLTPEAAAQIRYFYKRPMWIGFVTLLLLFIGGYAAGTAAYIYLHQGILGTLVFAALLIGTDRWLYHRKIKRAEEVYQTGNQVTINLVSVADNYSFRMNGAPQQIITLNKGAELVNIKTFSAGVVRAFSPASQPAYVDDRYPDILIPAAIFSRNFYNPDPSSAPKQKVRDINL